MHIKGELKWSQFAENKYFWGIAAYTSSGRPRSISSHARRTSYSKQHPFLLSHPSPPTPAAEGPCHTSTQIPISSHLILNYTSCGSLLFCQGSHQHTDLQSTSPVEAPCYIRGQVRAQIPQRAHQDPEPQKNPNRSETALAGRTSKPNSDWNPPALAEASLDRSPTPILGRDHLLDHRPLW